MGKSSASELTPSIAEAIRSPASMLRDRRVLIALLLAAVCGAYANHFHNSFHFDDFHTVANNTSIRSLSNIPRFFTDVRTSSILPSNRAWRPLVTTSLAIDYWLGSGLNPVAFHATTFLLYLVQIVLLFLLFERLFNAARPGQENRVPAALGAAFYGLHPICAETVNYVAQRAELYSTLGVIAALYIYIARPRWTRYGIYLIPLAAAQLSKPPALVFPALLFVYLYLFEHRKRGRALLSIVPSLVLTALIALLQSAMTPATFVAGATSPLAYRLTQPFVALRYFESFLLPVRLSADTDLIPFASAMQPEALAGFAFLIAVVALAALTSRRWLSAPIAFGLWWFVLALAPTSFYPLAEVENDHRVFFPLVGLVLSATWLLTLALRNSPSRIVLPSALMVLAVCAYGTNRRNAVWKDESSLWRDVTLKSPANGRGLMNYGLTLMAAGDIRGALDYFNRALIFTPNYNLLEVNLGIAHSQLRQDAEAEQHFARAVALAPLDAQPAFYYGRWLVSRGRTQEALLRLRAAESLNPGNPDARLLIASIATGANSVTEELARLERAAAVESGAEGYLNLSLRYHGMGRYRDCIRAARLAIERNPRYAEAYNNLAAGYESLADWDNAIQAAREAIRLKPDFTLARNNLAWSESQKALGERRQNLR